MAERGIQTYAEAAEQLGVTQPQVSKWLNGDPPADDKAQVLADFLRSTVDEVLPLLYSARMAKAASTQRIPRAAFGIAHRAATELEDSVVALLERHGFQTSRNNREAGVDIVARRENEVIGIEVKSFTGPRNEHNRLREALAGMVIFDRWAALQGFETHRGVVVVSHPVKDSPIVSTLEHVGAIVVHDDLDAILRSGGRVRVEPGDFVRAADDRPPPQERSQNKTVRPRDAPEGQDEP